MKSNNDLVTKKDLELFGKKLEKKLEQKLEQKLNAKFDQQLNEIRDDMQQWHSDIFNLVDGLAIEIRDGREHREITSHQIKESRVRIEKLEKKVFGVVSS